MKNIFLIAFIFFCCFNQASCACNSLCCGHGHIENSKDCVCMSTWTGSNCEIPGKIFVLKYNFLYFHKKVTINKQYFSDYNESSFYDWREVHLRRRLPRLYNLEPGSASIQNDEEFPENYTSLNTTAIRNEWTCNFLKKLLQQKGKIFYISDKKY